MTTLILAVGLVLGWTLAGLFATAWLYQWENPVEPARDSDTEESGG